MKDSRVNLETRVTSIVLAMMVGLAAVAHGDDDALTMFKSTLASAIKTAEPVNLGTLDVAYEVGKDIENGRANMRDKLQQIEALSRAPMMRTIITRYTVLTTAQEAQKQQERMINGLFEAWSSNPDAPSIREWIGANQSAAARLSAAVAKLETDFLDRLGQAQRQIDDCADRKQP